MHKSFGKTQLLNVFLTVCFLHALYETSSLFYHQLLPQETCFHLVFQYPPNLLVSVLATINNYIYYIILIIFTVLLQLPNKVNLVLLKFNDNLFLSNHIFSLHISVVILPSCSCKSPPEQKILGTSENNTNHNILETLHVSFILNMNNFGPNTDTWGTPQAMSGTLMVTPRTQIAFCCLNNV